MSKSEGVNYALFGGSRYYPVGGWRDFLGKFPDRTAAKEAARLFEQKAVANDESSWWIQIVDLSTMSEVIYLDDNMQAEESK
mgnify:CR=1 FL=1